MLSSVEQAFVGRDENRAPLKTPAWEANMKYVPSKFALINAMMKVFVSTSD